MENTINKLQNIYSNQYNNNLKLENNILKLNYKIHLYILIN